MQQRYSQSEAFHYEQVQKLREEIESNNARGNAKEAEAHMAYLSYHQTELKKIRGIMELAGVRGSQTKRSITSFAKPFDSCVIRLRISIHIAISLSPTSLLLTSPYAQHTEVDRAFVAGADFPHQ